MEFNIEKIIKLLGLKIDETQPCDVYVNYFMQYIAELERKIWELRDRVKYLEYVCKNK